MTAIGFTIQKIFIQYFIIDYDGVKCFAINFINFFTQFLKLPQ